MNVWFRNDLINRQIKFLIKHLILLSCKKYKVVTNINVYSENSVLFPSVSICNQNPFVTDYAIGYVKSTIEKLFMNKTFTTTSKFLEQLIFQRSVIKSILSLESNESKKQFAFPFNQTFLTCIFNGKSCVDEDFECYFDFNHGNCYMFNGGQKNGLKYSNQLGKYIGLTIEYFLGIHTLNK